MFAAPRSPHGPSIRLAPTFELGADLLAQSRSLMVRVFDGEFEVTDWEHALGSMHAIAMDDDTVVGHASVVARQLHYDGRALRAGYVEAVGVYVLSTGEPIDVTKQLICDWRDGDVW